MGFVSNIIGTLADSTNSVLNDQFIETFRTDSLGQRVLIKRAYRLNNKGHNQGCGEVITAGSQIIVPEGTYALMLDNGKIADCTTQPGVYTWKNSSSASIFSGDVKGVMNDVFNRFKFAGEVVADQRIYYVNGLEIMNQTCDKYLSVPYPDPVYGNLYFKFMIMFSFRIVDPVRFFKCIGREIGVFELMGSSANPGQPIREVCDHMEEALNLCATRDKIPFPQLISNKSKLKNAVNEVVSKLWYERRGMVVESIALTDLTLDEASRARVEQFDSAKIFSQDPAALEALATLGFIKALNTAAGNSAGAVAGMAGVAMTGAKINVRKACPFCGTILPQQTGVINCPSCGAKVRL